MAKSKNKSKGWFGDAVNWFKDTGKKVINGVAKVADVVVSTVKKGIDAIHDSYIPTYLTNFSDRIPCG